MNTISGKLFVHMPIGYIHLNDLEYLGFDQQHSSETIDIFEGGDSTIEVLPLPHFYDIWPREETTSTYPIAKVDYTLATRNEMYLYRGKRPTNSRQINYFCFPVLASSVKLLSIYDSVQDAIVDFGMKNGMHPQVVQTNGVDIYLESNMIHRNYEPAIVFCNAELWLRHSQLARRNNKFPAVVYFEHTRKP